LRTQAIELSKPNPLKFIDYLKENPIMEGFPEEQPQKLIKSLELYKKYREWCVESGERNIVSARKFTLTIQKTLIKKRMSSGSFYELPELNE
jgi:phage/plasmid-associated DNA primase